MKNYLVKDLIKEVNAILKEKYIKAEESKKVEDTWSTCRILNKLIEANYERTYFNANYEGIYFDPFTRIVRTDGIYFVVKFKRVMIRNNFKMTAYSIELDENMRHLSEKDLQYFLDLKKAEKQKELNEKTRNEQMFKLELERCNMSFEEFENLLKLSKKVTWEFKRTLK